MVKACNVNRIGCLYEGSFLNAEPDFSVECNIILLYT